MNRSLGGEHWWLYLRLTVLLSLEFIVIYGGTNWLTQYRADVHRIYFDWELGIPMVPVMVFVYASIGVLALLPVFYLESNQLRRLASQLALAILLAGVVFLVYPGQIGYEPIADLPLAIRVIQAVDLPYNLVPSLHVALSVLIMLPLARVFKKTGRLVLLAWLIAMIASVLLTHQHHLADVLGAAILAWLCQRLLPQDISA